MIGFQQEVAFFVPPIPQPRSSLAMSSVVRSRKSKPKKPNRPLSPEEKFQQQWDKIQRLRQQNEQLPTEVAKLAAWVTQVVETEERA